MKLYRVVLEGGLYYVEAKTPEQAIKKAQTAAKKAGELQCNRGFRSVEHVGEVLR